jgi:hypothetical protein
MPAALDREGCRVDPRLIGQWERSVDAEYRALLEGVDVSSVLGAEAVREFEGACIDDREWAAGYRAGRADAQRLERGEPPEGPGVSWFGDGWSAGLTRQAAYDLGLDSGRR